MVRVKGSWAKTVLAARFANLAPYKRRNYIPRKLHCPHSVQTTTKCWCKKLVNSWSLRNMGILLSPVRCFCDIKKGLSLYLSVVTSLVEQGTCLHLSQPAWVRKKYFLFICSESTLRDELVCRNVKNWGWNPDISTFTFLKQKTNLTLHCWSWHVQ